MSTLRLVFGGIVFGAALLLFSVEPMAAKQLLPVLGGASSVWITCLLFFQVALLLGYLYAHWMSRSRRFVLHACVLAVAIAAAFGWISLSSGAGIKDHWTAAWLAQHPVRTIFEFAGGTVGVPFVLLASTSPLLQVWWVRIFGGRVPYGLFALSNAGSLLGLALYPVVIEPHMTLHQQRLCWVVCFSVYAAACSWLGFRVSRTLPIQTVISDEPETAAEHQPSAAWYRRTMWFLLPMAAAMQLSAVTGHLTQDVAAVPMLWVVPLGTYLLTFIVAFERPQLYRRWLLARALAVLLGSLGYALSRVDATLPIDLAILFYMVELFVAGWFCHAEAYRLRPSGARESTVFYLMVAAGGAAGTLVVAVVSPLLFRSNYDLAISFLLTAALAAVVTWKDGWGQRLLWSTGTVLLAVLIGAIHISLQRQSLMRSRNFYGALRVTQTDTDTSSRENIADQHATPAAGDIGTGPVRTLMNGRIRHGMQMLEADRRNLATTYYGGDSGIGVALRNCCAGPKRVGVIGLGAGTLAAYGEAGDRFWFYEINPAVEPIARNLFTFLRNSHADTSVATGDGRALLEREPPHRFNVLIVDAFSGDAIPLHLLTREAMSVYKSQIAPGGVIAFHVSNSYLDLAPEIALLARDAHMESRRVESWAVPAEGAYRATWVLVSDDNAFFAKPAIVDVSTRISPLPGLRVWTDDYSSLLGVLRWTK